MDEDGLPLVGPGVDYTKVSAIHQKRTVAFLNHFITHTVRFLNRFSCVCEEKLSTLSLRIQRLETTMNILEAKLGSIPGLENVTVQSSAIHVGTEATQSQTAGGSGEVSIPAAGPAAAPASVEAAALPDSAVPPPLPSEPEKPTMTVSQDPRYAKFFKLILVGVPAQAIRPKMIAEGLNPDLLDTPDAPAPSGGPADQDSDDDDFSNKESNSSDDFSD